MPSLSVIPLKSIAFDWLKAYSEGLKERLKIFGYLFQQTKEPAKHRLFKVLTAN
jgi:hypothetical protein